MRKLLASLFIIAALGQNVAVADTAGCVDAKIIGKALIENICWKCVFPIRVAGVKLGGNQDGEMFVNKDDGKGGTYTEVVKLPTIIPSNATDQKLCMCSGDGGVYKPGIVTSFWQPAYLAEFQRVPGCSSVLNGVRFPFDKTFMGSQRHASWHRYDGEKTFRHYHFYSFPLMEMLDVFVAGHCNAGGYFDLDMMYMSELDPTWNNDVLAFFTSFEAALVANPVGVAACIPDSFASMAGHPIDPLWWCAGSWGTIYPLSGNLNGRDGILRTTSVMKVRMMAALHRRGMMYGTVGDANLCGGNVTPRLPKTQYRFTLMHPVPETKRSHAMGEPILFWGTNRTIPSVGEDPIYVIWRWMDCCNT